MSALEAKLVESIKNEVLRKGLPNFRSGDTLRVHARIVEGQKERVQVFEGVVIKRHKGSGPQATFTVRKVSYNIGVERTFLLHSPRIEKIEVLTRGRARRARLFHLRPLRGKAARIKTRMGTMEDMSSSAALELPTNGHVETAAESPATNTEQA